MLRFKRKTASRLRADQTSAERRLWAALSHITLEGSHFRRQVLIGRYVVDLACMAARLVIELDGAPHSRDDVAARDKVRQAWLEGEGFRVLRFWNEDVFKNLNGVLDTIYAALHGEMAAVPERLVHKRRTRLKAHHPTPDLRSDPPPAGEG